MPETLKQPLITSDARPNKQPLAAETHRNNVLQISHDGADFTRLASMMVNPLRTAFARNGAIWDDQTFLQTKRQTKPTSINVIQAVVGMTAVAGAKSTQSCESTTPMVHTLLRSKAVPAFCLLSRTHLLC